MDSFDRGKAFELKVAKMLRLKIDRSAKRNAGSHANWHRRSDIFTDLPFHIEAKDHETVRPKEWFRQADEASFGKTPVVAFQMDEEVMAVLRFDDFCNLLVEIADQKAEIEDLKRPIATFVQTGDIDRNGHIELRTELMKGSPKLTDGTLNKEINLCRNGHICSPGKTTCQTKGCQYSSTYRPPKAKKGEK